jgi:acetyl-CoA carboxylase biotin carboxyl carrier protein
MAGEFTLSPEDVADIVSIVDASGYDKVEVATTRFRLVLSRKNEGWTQEWNWHQAPAADAPAQVAVPAAATAAAAAVGHAGLTPIPAPLPGTFYRAPQPGAPPYVNEGDRVDEGTILGIIETMKLMSTVSASGPGTVAQILVANGTAIDAQTLLMLIKPDLA